MRPRPLAILLLLVLSSFVIAQAKGGEAGFMGIGGGGAGAIGGSLSGLSCLTSINGLIPVVAVFASAGGLLALRKSKGEGMNIAALLGPILGISIIIQALMNGALCKSNFMQYILVFVGLQTWIEESASNKNPIFGIVNMVITMSSFQYILSTPSLMNNPTAMWGYIMGMVVVSSMLNSVAGSGMAVGGFGRNILSGLKSIAAAASGPEGGEIEEELEKELEPKLKEVRNYIAETKKKIENRIKNEQKKAKTAALQQRRALGGKRSKYEKIEQGIFKDANELYTLSTDLLEDQKAMYKRIEEINNFEKTLNEQIKTTFRAIVSFVRTHNEENAETLTNKGKKAGIWITEEMKSLSEIRSKLDVSFNITLNGVITFAKLSVLIAATAELLKTASKYLKDTSKNERKEEVEEKKQTNKTRKKLEKGIGEIK